MNCKEGDIAVIVYDDKDSENAGLLVDVVSYYGINPDFPDRGPNWICQSLGSPCKCSVDSNGVRPMVMATKFCCPDAWLRPIRPGELNDEDVDQLELTETNLE